MERAVVRVVVQNQMLPLEGMGVLLLHMAVEAVAEGTPRE
jgi:hypothetical protein